MERSEGNKIGWRGLDASGWGREHVTDCYEQGNETAGFMKCGEFLDFLRKYKVFEEELLH